MAVSALHAGRTRTWEQTRYEDFQKGTSKGVAIRSDGALELAPSFRTVSTTPSTYIWAAASDAQGNVYAAAGAPARVYRITPAGQTTVIFEPQELQVQSLAIAPEGVIYAATSPDGKVYRIERKAGAAPPAKQAESQAKDKPAEAEPARTVTRDESYTSSVFFDPKTKYIWHLALDPEGRLYVATGDAGQIFRVTPSGQSSVFFKSDEAHIRVLAFDRGGNVIAGSDGSGLVYRISPAGEGFVLYSAPKKEITALAVDDAGNIYAAGAGEKRAGASSMSAASFNLGITTMPQPMPPAQGGIQVQTTPAQPQPAVAPMPMLGMTSTGSEVYVIAPDGSPRRMWQSREDLVYALAFDRRKRLLAGTGNKGRIFAIDRNGDFTDLVKASATQITAFAWGPEGGLYAASSNLGKVFALGASAASDGSFDSDVFDAQNFSTWGRVEVRGSGRYEIYTRSGNVDNPDRHWSEWKKLDDGGATGSPQARFLQWRAVLQPGDSPAELRSIRVHYLAKNVAPVIDDVAAAAGVRFQSIPRMQQNESASLNVSAGGQQQQQQPVQQPRFEMVPPAMRDRGSISARWSARDENEDDLTYSLYYRGDGESRWKLLAENLTDKYYTWDAGLLPDGGYTVRVVASDAPSNALDAALTSERESQRFEVDNIPPAIQDLTATLEAGGIRVSFRSTDSFSVISRAEYSVNAGEWQSVRPVGDVSDSRSEQYAFLIPLKSGVPPPPPAQTAQQKRSRRARQTDATAAETADPAQDQQEYVVVVRVYDRFENMSAAKTVVR